MRRKQRYLLLGLLIVIAILLSTSFLATLLAPEMRALFSPKNGRVTGADIASAEAQWNSKKADTYQIEVWRGGITPPPPVYVVQVWRGTVVYAHVENHPAMPGSTPQPVALDAPEAQAVTVPGLFDTARTRAQPKVTATITFDPEWGFPNNVTTSSSCIDCVWFCRVQKFQAFDSAAPPPTTTPR